MEVVKAVEAIGSGNGKTKKAVEIVASGTI
jgi:hypothetical protein